MTFDKDAWLFGLSTYVVTLVFNMTELFAQKSLIALIMLFFLFSVPAGVGYFIGQLKHRKAMKLKYIVVGAGLAYLLSNTCIRLLGLDTHNWYIFPVTVLSVSIFVGWRLPQMFKQNDS